MNAERSPRERACIVVPSQVEEAVKVRKLIGTLLRLNGMTEEDSIGLEIAVGEGVANAVRHGSPHGADDNIEVTYEHVVNSHVEIAITDRGGGFDLESWLSHVKPLSLSDGERGLLLIAALTDSVTYTPTDQGGRLVLMKSYGRPSIQRSSDKAAQKGSTSGAGKGRAATADSAPRLRVA
jgi:anti-sigma regulatory factor (Ser/Thr protein kinase)